MIHRGNISTSCGHESGYESLQPARGVTASETHRWGKRKKVVCFEGDSAFGFSAMEVETMARYGMDVLIFVMNNGGVYHGDSDSPSVWNTLQQKTVTGATGGLRSTSLGWQVGYEKVAEMCGGKGWLVRSEAELLAAVREGWQSEVVGVVNVVIEAGEDQKLSFGWQSGGAKETKAAKL